MVIIGGLEDSVELPNSDIVKYVVENNPDILALKLKTSARSPECIAVYLHEEWSGIEMPDVVKEKASFFANTSMLLSMLGNEFSSSTEETEEPVVEELTRDFSSDAVRSHETTPILDTQEVQGFSDENDLGVKEVQTADDILIDLPVAPSNDSIESLTVKVESLTRLLQNKDETLAEINKELYDAYRLHEIQMLEMRKDYEERLEEANKRLLELNKAVSNINLSDSQKKLLVYSSYVENELGVYSHPLSQSDVNEIKGYGSPIYVMCAGLGRSTETFAKVVSMILQTDKSYFVIDMSGEVNLKFGLGVKEKIASHSLMLRNPSIPLNEVFKKVGGSYIAFSRAFNDISLLALDWKDIFQRVASLANGKPILLLLGSFSSFSVRATVGKLAPISSDNGQAYCFVHSNSLTLYNMLSYLSFIRKERLRIIGLEFIPQLEQFYRELGKHTIVKTFEEGVTGEYLVEKLF